MNQQHNPPLASQAGSSSHFAGDQPRSSSPLTVSVIDPQFWAQENLQLTITEDDDGKLVSAKDVAGNMVFQITYDKHTKLHKRLILLDAAGNPLVTLQRKIKTAAHKRWEVFKGYVKPSEDLLFRTVRPSSNQFPARLLDVFLATNDDDCAADFKVTGSWLEGLCTVYTGDSNNIIAQISKKPTKEKVSPGKDSTLSVTVYPNIDYAFIVALVVILHAIYTDEKGGPPSMIKKALKGLVAGAVILSTAIGVSSDVKDLFGSDESEDPQN